MEDQFSCSRCNGVMVLECITSPLYEYTPIMQVRCTSCGNVIDEVILKNRKNNGGQNGQ